MKLTYFGTAAAEGWPALYCSCPSCVSAREKGGRSIRTRSQALINDDLLLDFPADTYLHVLHYGLNLDPVRNILITHSHEDHLYIEDLSCRMNWYVADQYRSPWTLGVYGSSSVREAYDRTIQTRGCTPLPTVAAMHELTEFQPVQVGNYRVHPMLADHAKDAVCFIYAVEDFDGKALLYAHDTGYLREECWAYMKQQGLRFQMVSLDCTCGKQEEERNHMGLSAAARVKERLLSEDLAGPDTLFYVNHFSHNCLFLNHDEITAAASQHGMQVSYDGCAVEF